MLMLGDGQPAARWHDDCRAECDGRVPTQELL